MDTSSAGKGTPYWYEWTVGLIKVVEMLYAESGISSVSFQQAGIKGWDDVVVRYKDGRIEFIQVKHSRNGTNITFGSFTSRYDPEMARDFFNSLPGPEELASKNIRLFVAGQPAENYPEYPTWLRSPRSDVQRLNLGQLESEDIAALVKSASLGMAGG